MSDFVTNGDWPGGGQGDWGTGMGLLKVYVNSKTVPVLTVPLNMEATLKLDNGFVAVVYLRPSTQNPRVLTLCRAMSRGRLRGFLWVGPCSTDLPSPSCLPTVRSRAWVGFTAATGNAVWQTHDILSWEFLQTRQDWARVREEYPPDVVNGEGRHRCSGVYECIYPRDD